MPEAFFAYSTLWTDAIGARIEGTALPIHAEYLEARLRPKVVYDLTSFSLTFPRRSHRATSNSRYLQLTSAAIFEEVEDPGEAFALDSFEFVSIGHLSTRISPFPFLTDVVGSLVTLSEPDHITTVKGVARKQSVTISDDSNDIDRVAITLWGGFCDLLVPSSLMPLTASGPVIVAFGGMLVTAFRGQLSLASSSATRIMVDPQVVHPLVAALKDVPCSVLEVLQAKFPSPELIEEHVRDSFRNIAELHDLAHSSAPNENRYRCRATVQYFDDAQQWCYKACKVCTRAVVAVDGKFWCDRHELLTSEDTTFCYKIQLRVADSTGEATFLLLGYSADSIMPITAADLRRSFPVDGSGFPPQIDMFRDLTLTFELQQPDRPRPGSFADFRVTRIFDLPASFGSRRSYSRLSKPTLDAPVKANEISRGACLNSPGLGAGSLGFSSPPRTPVAGCSTVNCGYSHEKQWGHIHLPSPPEISAGVLSTPDKADGLPRLVFCFSIFGSIFFRS